MLPDLGIAAGEIPVTEVRIRSKAALRTTGGRRREAGDASRYADSWLGDLVNKISKTSRSAPTTIALSATLKAGHWCWPT